MFVSQLAASQRHLGVVTFISGHFYQQKSKNRRVFFPSKMVWVAKPAIVRLLPPKTHIVYISTPLKYRSCVIL